jgi:DNA-binding response OmpR family regulator
MMAESRPPGIVLIDRQDYWRGQAAAALSDAGLSVLVTHSYDAALEGLGRDGTRPDLVILGCSEVGPDESHLVDVLVRQQLPVLVLSTELTFQAVQALFSAGVSSVERKPFDMPQLVGIVRLALSRLRPRDAYEAMRATV